MALVIYRDHGDSDHGDSPRLALNSGPEQHWCSTGVLLEEQTSYFILLPFLLWPKWKQYRKYHTWRMQFNGQVKKPANFIFSILKTKLVTSNHEASKKLHSAFVTWIGRGMFRGPQNTGEWTVNKPLRRMEHHFKHSSDVHRNYWPVSRRLSAGHSLQYGQVTDVPQTQHKVTNMFRWNNKFNPGLLKTKAKWQRNFLPSEGGARHRRDAVSPPLAGPRSRTA